MQLMLWHDHCVLSYVILSHAQFHSLSMTMKCPSCIQGSRTISVHLLEADQVSFGFHDLLEDLRRPPFPCKHLWGHLD